MACLLSEMQRINESLIVHLIDGTYELFRHFYGVPPHRTAEGAEVAATRGVLWSMLRLLEGGVTHLGVATDHVIESFRNGLWPGYKSSAGLDPALEDDTILTIASRWGLPGPQHFSRLFRSAYGCSPSDLRRERRSAAY